VTSAASGRRATPHFDVALEQCSGCLQLYRWELRRHCAVCDGELCPFCVVHVQAEWRCFGCKEDGDVSTRDVEG
jgi:hypothetical protein